MPRTTHATVATVEWPRSFERGVHAGIVVILNPLSDETYHVGVRSVMSGSGRVHFAPTEQNCTVGSHCPPE
eukprot:scaffold99292_cov72-Phaeocystis_antarctica.AAC.2